MKPPTDQELTHLAKLCEAATPGPWEFDFDDCCYADAVCNKPVLEPMAGQAIEVSAEDKALIVAARQWLGPLLTEIQRLRSENGVLKAVRTHVLHTPIGFCEGRLLCTRKTTEADIIKWLQDLRELVA